jgi:hypothetical protein
MEPEGQQRSGGFNWVALLFAAGVVTVLLCAIIPALNDAQDAGRRTHCSCHGRNISTALLNYENSHHEFPGYSNLLLMSNKKVYLDQRTGKKSGVSWPIMVLRQLDRPDLYDDWKTPTGVVARGSPTLDILVCPSDPRAGGEGTPLSYVVNCGMKDWAGSATMPRDWAENGVFFDQFTGDARVADNKADQSPIMHTSSAFISRHDGLQNTILLTENVDAGDYTDVDETRVGVLWNPRGTIDKTKKPPHLSPPDANMLINHGAGRSHRPGNADPAIFARPSSYHHGGVNMIFCDSHLKFISDKIDYYVYCLLMSPDGPRVREPRSDTVVPGFSRPVEDSWIY